MSNPKEYTVRQKLKQRIKIFECMKKMYGFSFPALMEVQYELLKFQSKSVAKYNEWNKI